MNVLKDQTMEQDHEVTKDRFNLNRKIFVGNISYRVTQKRLTKFFTKFGIVDYCYMVKDHIHKRPKGIAFITFSSSSEVDNALQASEDQLTLDGRIMRVSSAEESSRVKHMEGTVWDNPVDNRLVENLEQLHLNNKDNASQDEFDTSSCPDECHINKLCDDALILIMSILPWKQRICVERVCKKWNLLSKQSWHRQESLHFQSMFKRFDGLTDTKLCSILVRCGLYLRKLDISSSPRLLTDMSMDVIAEQCPNLEDIDLSGMAVTDISLRSLARKCTKLKSIRLQRCFHVSDKGLNWLFENCQDIESVDIQGNSTVTGNCFQKIGQKCKRLFLSECCKLTDVGIMKICRHCKQLELLAISNCQLLTDKSLEAISKNLVNLKILYLEKTFSHVTVNGLMKIGLFSKLKSVYLSQNLCVNNDIISALAVNCPFLETLVVSGCYRDVTGLGVQTLGICSNLTSLDISYLYKVDDESIQVLARSGRLKSLTARACSSLTDDAFEDLACLCPNLELLDVSGCLNLSNKIVRYFVDSTSLHQRKVLNLYVGGTSVVEEEVKVVSPFIALSFHDLSQNYLRGDRGIILPEPEPDTDSEEEDREELPKDKSTFSVLAAGAEIDNEIDDEWNTYDSEFMSFDDDLLFGDDPLEMERFESS